MKHSHGKKSSGGPRQDSRCFMVSTTLGNTLLEPSCKVPIEIGQHEFFFKPVEKLTAGDRVVFEKSGIEVRKEDLELQLRRGMRYQMALRGLYCGNEEGRISLFSAEVVRGALTNPERWPSEVNVGEIEGFVQNGTQLSDKTRSLCANAIYQALEGSLGIAPVSIEQIRNGWLRGETICPKEYADVVLALSSSLSPNMIDSIGTRDFERLYKKYVAMRISIALRLSNIMEGNGVKEGSQTKGPYLEVADRAELDEVVRYFAEELTARTAIATVTKVAPIKEGHEKDSANAIRLRKGVSLELPDNCNGLDYKEVHARGLVTEGYARWIIECSFSERIATSKDNFEKFMLATELYSRFGFGNVRSVINWAFSIARKRGILDEREIRELRGAIDIKERQEEVEDFYRRVFSGKEDDKYGLPNGSVIRLLRQNAALIANFNPFISFYGTLVRLALIRFKEKQDAYLERERAWIKSQAQDEMESARYMAYYGWMEFWGQRDKELVLLDFLGMVQIPRQCTRLAWFHHPSAELIMEAYADYLERKGFRDWAIETRTKIIGTMERKTLLQRMGLLEIGNLLDEHIQRNPERIDKVVAERLGEI